MVKVKNRDLGEITVHDCYELNGRTRWYFKSEAGFLDAVMQSCGELRIHDPAFPRLRYNAERFRPLLMEALSLWQAESTA